MDIDQLRTFEQIVQQGSFSKAAANSTLLISRLCSV
jgi:DNA-binding transcriptional LysR family regulator